jgi:hypothetical protein
MAKKKNKQNNTQNENQKFDDISQKLEEIKETENINQEEIDNTEVSLNATNLQVRNIENKFKEATQIQTILKKKQTEFEDKLKQVDEEKKEYETKKQELDESIKKYDTELEDINKLRVGNFSNIIDKKVIDRYSDSLNEQKDLLLIEIENLKKEHVKYISLISAKEQEIASSKIELRLKKEQLDKEYQQKIEEKEEELEKRLRDIKKQEKSLQYEIEDFNDEKEYLIKKAEEQVKEEIEQLESKHNIALERVEALQNKIAQLEDDLKYLGGRDPKNLIDDLTQKENKIWELEQKLAANSDLLDLDRLRQLTLEKIDYEANIREMEATVNEYKTKYENHKLSTNENELLKFQNEGLESRLKLQRLALNEMKEQYDKTLEDSKNKKTFISCMDMDEKYSEENEDNSNNVNFSKDWLAYMQQVIAQITKERLYYKENTIRSYIAGLAMSRLTILQGISGTGKTSLPKAFAQAIGGHYEIIEVQSGWKDRQDLIGYYNTFEKKYYESSFLKALYKANTPAYKNKPFFIILDEMNLSHPEHYFADLLSIMEETDKSKQKIKICDTMGNNPKFMEEIESELKLKIPENVWFIGTANHDETTVQFAPKTYDRANIMEMPKNHTSFKLFQIEKYKTTQDNDIFNKELNNNKYDADVIIDYLNNSDFKTICNDLGIGWGNRLDKQIRKFIPVFTALGGSEADAIDQLISSKILRTLKGKYSLNLSLLEELLEELENNFVEIFDGIPEKSLEIINEEMQKQKD